MNLEESHKAVRQAAIAAFISAGIGVLIVLFGMISGASGELSFFTDPWNLLDAAIAAGCGVALLRHSRAAAVMLFLFFIISQISTFLELGRPAGILPAIIFLYFFAKGIQGSFTYHRLRHDADPNYRAAPKWSYFLGIPVATLLFIAIGLGLLMEVGIIPSSAVIEGSELSNRDFTLMLDQGIVKSDETVQLFYSAGLTSIRDDGNLLTDRRIVSYERIDGELLVYETPFEEVADIALVLKGNFINDTIIEIWTIHGNGFRLFLSTENNGDERFVNEILKRINHSFNQEPQRTQTL